MLEQATRLQNTIDNYKSVLLSIDEETIVKLENRWCQKQILGHLIDSSINNLKRFITGYEAENLVFSGYDHTPIVRTDLAHF